MRRLIFPPVRHRAFRISLLALIAVWFGVVVPLHPRGVIKLGGACGDSYAKACCHPGKSTAPDSKPKPGDPQCAICYFLVTLDLPPAMGMDVPKLGLVEQMAVSAAIDAPVMIRFNPTSERGPPTV